MNAVNGKLHTAEQFLFPKMSGKWKVEDSNILNINQITDKSCNQSYIICDIWIIHDNT